MLFTSEWVMPGHPDKVADQISDAILNEYLLHDRNARVAVEVMLSAGGVVIAGEVASDADVDREMVARNVLRSIGYSDRWGYDPDGVTVQDFVTAQSIEISLAVQNPTGGRVQGAGDQGLMFGYATRETPELMPLPLMLARDIGVAVYLNKPDWVGPDGKTQVTYDYANNRVDTVVVSGTWAE